MKLFAASLVLKCRGWMGARGKYLENGTTRKGRLSSKIWLSLGCSSFSAEFEVLPFAFASSCVVCWLIVWHCRPWFGFVVVGSCCYEWYVCFDRSECFVVTPCCQGKQDFGRRSGQRAFGTVTETLAPGWWLVTLSCLVCKREQVRLWRRFCLEFVGW